MQQDIKACHTESRSRRRSGGLLTAAHAHCAAPHTEPVGSTSWFRSWKKSFDPCIDSSCQGTLTTVAALLAHHTHSDPVDLESFTKCSRPVGTVSDWFKLPRGSLPSDAEAVLLSSEQRCALTHPSVCFLSLLADAGVLVTKRSAGLSPRH